MNNRRTFLESVAAMGVLASATPVQALEQPAAVAGGNTDRRYWIRVLEQLAAPVLGHLAKRELRKTMPVEAADPVERRKYTHLEAFGRLLAGMAPWLEVTGLGGDEERQRHEYLDLARLSLDAATDPESPDFMNFDRGGQPLVDTAFLAQALLRAPRALRDSLDARVRQQVIAALRSSRAVPTPTTSNWTMFAATVEAALLEFGEPTQEERLESCVHRMLGWYKGDGVYGDGEWFHCDYYNSFVIQPMLVDVLAALCRRDNRYAAVNAIVLRRSRRYAEIQERLIAPDGTFPVLGRSMTYRFGALQTLAQMSLLRDLPQGVQPAQVRCAMTAVIRRMIEAPGTFDESGWLRIGFCGHQPALAERYISTGSLYLCSTALLPLGLPPADPFWNDLAAHWTSQRLWSGESLPADHALEDGQPIEIPSLKRDA
ncbi:MAG TPA: DUF2264 domain-containing protein [Povalibacter sp.]